MIQGASFCGWMGGREAPWKEETFEEALELGWGGVPGKGSGAQRCPWQEGGEGLVAPSGDLGRVYTVGLSWEWGRLARCLIGEGFEQICVWNHRPGLKPPALRTLVVWPGSCSVTPELQFSHQCEHKGTLLVGQVHLLPPSPPPGRHIPTVRDEQQCTGFLRK